jgi:hypothetical protein
MPPDPGGEELARRLHEAEARVVREELGVCLPRWDTLRRDKGHYRGRARWLLERYGPPVCGDETARAKLRADRREEGR